MKINGVAFDLEGTVVDVESAHHNGHIAAAAEFGANISIDEAYKRLPHFIGGPDDKVCEDIRNLLDPSAQKQVTVQEILDRSKFHYERLLSEIPIIPRPGFLQAFTAVRNLGLGFTIGSLTSEKQAWTLLDRSGLSTLFGKENIVLREHVKNVKPAPDVFLKTAEIMGVDPRNQLVFEDSPRGVTAALTARSKAVGMPVVIRGLTVAALVDAGVSRLFFDWREINMVALISNLQTSD